MNGLFLNAKDGNCDALRLMLESGAKVNRSLSNGATAVHAAAAHNHPKTLKELLDADANVNITMDGQISPLFLACWHAKGVKGDEVSRLLLEKGARVNGPTRIDNTTPLFIAALKGNTGALERVIHAGADINRVRNDMMNSTALLAAARRGNLMEVKKLLQAGADVKAVDSDGCSPLFLAAENGNADIIKELLSSGAKVNMDIDLNGMSALHIASCNGHLEAVTCLLDSGGDAFSVDKKSGRSPLYVAVQNRHFDVAKFLLNKGRANVNFQQRGGYSCLHIAVLTNQFEMVKLLLDAGAHVGLPKIDGISPLHIAAKSGNVDMIEAMLKAHERFITLKDSDGEKSKNIQVGETEFSNAKRALRKAMKMGKKDLVLMKAKNGMNPLTICRAFEDDQGADNKYSKCIELLKAYGKSCKKKVKRKNVNKNVKLLPEIK
eukprot:g3552.t1